METIPQSFSSSIAAGVDSDHEVLADSVTGAELASVDVRAQ
jgi:hypothetical protein